MRSAAATSHTSRTFDVTAGPGSEIGTATLRSIKHDSGNTDVAGGVFRLFVDNIQMTSGPVSYTHLTLPTKA